MPWLVFLVFFHSLFAADGQSITQCTNPEPTNWVGNAYYYKTITLDAQSFVDTLDYAYLFQINITDAALTRISTCYPGSTVSTSLEIYNASCVLQLQATVDPGCTFTTQTSPGSTLTLTSGNLAVGLYYVLMFAPSKTAGDATLTLVSGCNPNTVSSWMTDLTYTQNLYTVSDADLFYATPSALLFQLNVTEASVPSSFTTCDPNNVVSTNMALYDNTCTPRYTSSSAPFCTFNTGASYLYFQNLTVDVYYLLIAKSSGGDGQIGLTLRAGCSSSATDLGSLVDRVQQSYILANTDMFMDFVWAILYAFNVANASFVTTISTCDGTSNLIDSQIFIYDSNCKQVPALFNDDDPTCLVNPKASGIRTNLPEGTWYVLVVDKAQSTTPEAATFNLYLTPGCTPYAQALWNADGRFALSNDTLTSSDMALNYAYAKVYQFTYPSSSIAFNITTCDSFTAFNATLELYDEFCKRVNVPAVSGCPLNGGNFGFTMTFGQGQLLPGLFYVLVYDGSATSTSGGGLFSLIFDVIVIPFSDSPSEAPLVSESPNAPAVSESPNAPAGPTPSPSPSASPSPSPATVPAGPTPSPSPSASPSPSPATAPAGGPSPSPSPSPGAAGQSPIQLPSPAASASPSNSASLSSSPLPSASPSRSPSVSSSPSRSPSVSRSPSISLSPYSPISASPSPSPVPGTDGGSGNNGGSTTPSTGTQLYVLIVRLCEAGSEASLVTYWEVYQMAASLRTFPGDNTGCARVKQWSISYYLVSGGVVFEVLSINGFIIRIMDHGIRLVQALNSGVGRVVVWTLTPDEFGLAALQVIPSLVLASNEQLLLAFAIMRLLISGELADTYAGSAQASEHSQRKHMLPQASAVAGSISIQVVAPYAITITRVLFYVDNPSTAIFLDVTAIQRINSFTYAIILPSSGIYLVYGYASVPVPSVNDGQTSTTTSSDGSNLGLLGLLGLIAVPVILLLVAGVLGYLWWVNQPVEGTYLPQCDNSAEIYLEPVMGITEAPNVLFPTPAAVTVSSDPAAKLFPPCPVTPGEGLMTLG